MMDKLALTLVTIGAINWGSVGLFKFDIVGFIFGGTDSLVSRIIFTLVCGQSQFFSKRLYQQTLL